MFVMREVVHCRPGKAGELVRRFKLLSELLEQSGFNPYRILTDVSGEKFWTVVGEIEVETLDQFRELEQQVMGSAQAREIMSGYHELIAEGRREFFKIQA